MLGPHLSLLPFPASPSPSFQPFHSPSLSNHVCALFHGFRSFPHRSLCLECPYFCVFHPLQTQLNVTSSVKTPWISQGGLGAACLGSKVLCEGRDWISGPSTLWPGLEEVSVKGCWTIWMLDLGSPVAIRLPARRSGEVSSNHWQPAPHSPASLVHRLAGFLSLIGAPPPPPPQ